MGHPPRYIPEYALVEVTTRTMQGRFLLRPSRELNEVACGVIARAAGRYDVGVCYFVVLSNHMHMLLRPRDAEQLALFMDYVNGNLAKEAGRLHHWRERFWARRYRPIVVSDEPAAQIARLRYMLAQGCKEGLVRSPRYWPGASSLDALLTGGRVRGWWFDRTTEYQARRRYETFSKYTYAKEQELELAPLPCWQAVPAEERRQRVARMVREIERETRERLEKQGATPMGRKRLLRQHPHDAPERPSRSPAPRFHVASHGMRQSLEVACYEFRLAYRQAADALRSGKIDVAFPPGCFPPRLPFATFKPPPVAIGSFA